ncbi:uncharacterized protein LOC135834500 isoform X7 [Planococcus citri]|uniref:uncharacterized protein LOC135834500 isoform X7 n=1 Tax=Planococcus citri TaxID=170843 RepID=UPI0031F96941
MTEMVSNVHDLMYPSPATLKEISCQALVTGLWRWGVENRVADDFISSLDMSKNLHPNVPSSIKRMIDVYSKSFITSIKEWLAYHHEKLLFERNDMTSILLNFCDFIYDRDGTVRYSHAAERMMTCDRLSNDEKFKIACLYCFEDDIRRIWPSVSERLDLNEIEFEERPELFYWICMLRNEPHRIPNPDDDPINELMIEACAYCSSKDWSSVEYFWNRIGPDIGFSAVDNLRCCENEPFVRFVMPKLSDQMLDRFVLERGNDLIYDLVTCSQYKFYTLPTWMYIRNRMNENQFTDLIGLFIRTETNGPYIHTDINNYHIMYVTADLEDWSSTEVETYLCCEIWRNSPNEWKRSAIRNILTQGDLFVRDAVTCTEYREIRFLSTVLSDASFEDRNDFWNTNWRNLIVDTRGKDLHRIMKLCFEDENDIAKFKETRMFAYESISARCIKALRLGYFEQFDDILIFCCPDTQKRMGLKQRLLRSCISNESFVLELDDFSKLELMNEFINDTFDNAEVAADFKNRIICFCDIGIVLDQCISLSDEYSSDQLIHFIGTFVSNEEVTNLLKQRISEHLRNWLPDYECIWHISVDDLQKALVWCLGNEEEVTKFKHSVIPMSDFFANDDNWQKYTPLEVKINDRDVGGFLKWYIRYPEEIDEFNRLFADRFTV